MKKCEICGKPFTPTVSWQKRCGNDKCRKKANSLRVIKHKEKHKPLVKTLYEMKTKEPHKTNYEKIMEAFRKHLIAPFEDIFSKNGKQKEKYLKRHEKQRNKITVPSLSRETGLSRDTLLKYLPILMKLGVVEETGNGFSLTEKHRLEPIKLHYDSLIKDTSMEYIYPGLEYMLLLPGNLNAKEFSENGLTVLFEEAFDKFFDSVRLILLHARLGKAKELWTVKISSNMDIYPPLKLHLWIEMLTSQITNLSPVLRMANIYDRKLDIEEEIQNCMRSLSQLIFRDICQWLRYCLKDIEKMNDRMQRSFNAHFEYLNNIWNEIHEIIEEKEFGVVISPSAFLKPQPPDFSEGFKWLLKEKKEQKLVKVQGSGKKRVIQKTTVKDSIKNSLSFSPPPSKVEEIGVGLGKSWFNDFSKDTQDELRNLYSILGYTENTFYQVLGLFVFPLPILVMPIKKGH